MSTQPKTYVTPEQYLEIERAAEYKSEYYQGEMFAMSRANWNHNLVVAGVLVALHAQLRSSPSETYQCNMRVLVSATGLYTYPDVIVVCTKPQFLDDRQDTLLNPTLIAEVLSPSTEAYDRGRKFEHYRSLESLAEYLLVSSQRVSAELYARQPDGRWLLTAANSLEDTLQLPATGCRLPLGDIYEKVQFVSGPTP